MRKVYLLLLLMVIIGCATSNTAKTKIDQDMWQVSVSDFSQKNKGVEGEDIQSTPPPLIDTEISSEIQKMLSTPVSLTIKDSSLKEVILSMASQAKINVIFDSDLEDKKISISLHAVPFRVALKGILDSYDLYYTIYPEYIRISKMETRFFQIDYVISTREGSTSTQISLSSGSSSQGASSASGENSESSVSGGTTSSGNIQVTSSEVMSFWSDFEKNLREILKDPLYNILKAEYQRKLIKKGLELLPFDEEYERETKKQQLEILSLQKELLKKQIETGESSSLASLSTVTSGGATSGGETTGATSETSGETEQESIVGSYSIDPNTGTVVVTTTPTLMKRVEEFIAKVKENIRRQVIIDVQIFEVTLSKGKEIGIDWSNFPGSIELYKLPYLRQIINSQMLSQIGSESGSTTSSQGLSSPITGSPFPSTTNGNIQVGILRGLTPSVAFQWNTNAMISFLKRHGKVKAISRPHIVTLNNQPAIVSVGVNDFYVTYEQTTTSTQGGIASSSVTSKINSLFIGVSLTVTPQISKDGEIILKIIPAINKKIGEKSVPTGISSAPTQTIPIIETRQTSTVVKAKSGEPIIISGLIQEGLSKGNRSVPFLGKLPIIGNLFNYDSEEQERSELVMIIVPHLSYENYNELGYTHIK